MIEGVECNNKNSLYQIDKDRVIIGGWDTFSIVNIDKYSIEKTIRDISLINVCCFLKLKDNKTILCGWTFCSYDINTEE